MKKKKPVTQNVTKRIKGTATITLEPFSTNRELTEIDHELIKYVCRDTLAEGKGFGPDQQ